MFSVFSVAAVFLLWTSAACAADDAPPSWTAAVAPSVRWGRLDGFLQVPRGGEPGTASTSRPGLDEVGLDETLSAGVRAEGRWERHALLLDAWLLDASGSAVVADPFVSRGTTFGPDERVRASLGLATYRIAYGYVFELPEAWGGRLTLAPLAGAGLLDFSTRLRGERAGTTSRAFRHGLWQVGLATEWSPTDRLSLSFTALGNPPLRPLSGAFTADLLARWRVLGSPLGPSLSVFAGPGVGFFEIEDGQTLPNHVRALAGPVLIAGVEVRF